jgi:hypothetical protein
MGEIRASPRAPLPKSREGLAIHVTAHLRTLLEAQHTNRDEYQREADEKAREEVR